MVLMIINIIFGTEYFATNFLNDHNKLQRCSFFHITALNLLNIIGKYLYSDALKRLLKEASQELLSNFTCLEEAGMRVVCRLFWRQPGWYRKEQIAEIAKGKQETYKFNINDILKSLVQNRWIISAQSEGIFFLL